MIIKQIEVHLTPGRRDAFLARQRAWNDGMARQPGFLGVEVALDPDDPDRAWVFARFDSRDALDHFMAGDHDRLMVSADMTGLYERLDVRVLDVVDPPDAGLRVDDRPSRAAPGHQIAFASEAYRLGLVLRAAVLSGLCDHVPEGGVDVPELARRLALAPEAVARLVDGLAAMNLAWREGDRVTLRAAARDYLRRESPRYMGELVLHDTRPALLSRWAALADELGVHPVADADDTHGNFIGAMSAYARGGQVEALLAGLRETGGLPTTGTLLDVGGARGDYALALCERAPELRAVVLDQAATAAAARDLAVARGLGQRVAFAAGDYRSALPNGPFEVALLSNVLRGERPTEAKALLRRIHDALAPGGELLLQDLVGDGGVGPQRHAFFGLHLPDAFNPREPELVATLAEAGFTVRAVRRLDGWVASNLLVRASRA